MTLGNLKQFSSEKSKNKWLRIIIALMIIQFWPFIINFLIGKKIYLGNIRNSVKYALLFSLAASSLIIGPTWPIDIDSQGLNTAESRYETNQPESLKEANEMDVIPDNEPTPTSLVPTIIPTVSPEDNVETQETPVKGKTTNTNRAVVRVTRVIDGDTIEIEGGKRVRYIGMDTPEISGGTDCFGIEATNRNKALVLNKNVELEKDVSETDRYGRLLRYIYVDGIMINETLVREGFANAATFPPDVKYQQLFHEAEQQARNNNHGLWGACKQISPTKPTVEITKKFTPTVVIPPKSDSCNIKGNISSSGEKIYHLPGCRSYNQTIIKQSDGERMFCSEEEAIQAGWRKAKNCS